MQTKAMQGIVTITILRIATDRMTHISRMYADLVLTTCLKFELNQ